MRFASMLESNSSKVITCPLYLGKPWNVRNEDAYIESRFLVIQILMTFAIQQWKIQSVINLRGANPDIFYFTPDFTSNNNNLHEGEYIISFEITQN